MPDQPLEPAPAVSLTVQLIVDDPDDDHVRGRVELGAQSWEFAGWLALLSRLERLAHLAAVDPRQD